MGEATRRRVLELMNEVRGLRKEMERRSGSPETEWRWHDPDIFEGENVSCTNRDLLRYLHVAVKCYEKLVVAHGTLVEVAKTYKAVGAPTPGHALSHQAMLRLLTDILRPPEGAA